MAQPTQAQLEWLNAHPTYLRVGLGGNYKNCGTLYADGSFDPMAPMKVIVLRDGCFCVGERRDPPPTVGGMEKQMGKNKSWCVAVELDRLRARIRELEAENSRLRAVASRNDSRFVDGIPSDQE